MAVFDTLLSIMHTTRRQKINKEKQDWGHSIDLLDPTDVYPTFYLTRAGLFRINHI